ncbi:unnamed protein product, partial [Urochloa humidicola]
MAPRRRQDRRPSGHRCSIRSGGASTVSALSAKICIFGGHTRKMSSKEGDPEEEAKLSMGVLGLGASPTAQGRSASEGASPAAILEVDGAGDGDLG